MFDLLSFVFGVFSLFCFSMILAGVIRCEKHLKELNENFSIFVSYFVSKK